MLSSLVLLLLAGMNAFVCIDILFDHLKHRATDVRHIYTYQDSDYPLIPPNLTSTGPRLVSATFSESSWYTLLDSGSDPVNASARANGTPPPEPHSVWSTLSSPHYGSGYYYIGPHQNRVITRAYHAMHCVRMIVKELDTPAHAENPSEHFQHCLYYLRSVFLCAADQTLEEGDFMKRNYTLDRVGETRVCRDWTYMDEWLEVEFEGWLARNGMSLEDVDRPHMT